MNIKTKLLSMGTAAALLLAPLPALAGGFFTPGLQNYPSLSGVEQWPLDTELPNGANPQSGYVTTSQLAGGILGQAGSGSGNALIGGDFGTNPWQRGTSFTGITNTATFTADRFWAVGGSTSSESVSKQTGAADITQGFGASLRFGRASTNTDILPVCVGQTLTSAQSIRFQGQTAEFVFHALAGANFSAASSNITASVFTGTGSNQSTANLIAGSWTTQATAVAGVVPISTTWNRYSVVATIPVATTQIGVEICFTPVGTAGANDWVELAGVMLDVNPGAVALSGQLNTGNAKAFARLDPLEVQALVYSYYWQVNETNGVYIAPGMVSATNVERATLVFPENMIAIPTCTFTAGGLKWNIAGTNTAVGTLTQVTGSTSQFLTIGDTVTATAGGTAFLNGSLTTGKIACSAEL